MADCINAVLLGVASHLAAGLSTFASVKNALLVACFKMVCVQSEQKCLVSDATYASTKRGYVQLIPSQQWPVLVGQLGNSSPPAQEHATGVPVLEKRTGELGSTS